MNGSYLTDNEDQQQQKRKSSSSLRKCYMTGRAPWGFRIINDSNSLLNPSLLSNIIVSKVRSRSKAYYAGLKEMDVILFINDFPTHSLTLQSATDLIESANDLNLVVSTSNLRKHGLVRSGSVCSAVGIGNR